MLLQAVVRALRAAAGARPDLLQRLSAGLVLVGEGAGIRGLGDMLERRVKGLLAAAAAGAEVSGLDFGLVGAHLGGV
jgi:hypothetical protein